MPTLRDYINAELDAAYKRTAGGMLKTIESLATAPGSRMQARLASLEAEAARLAEAELSFTLTNADVMAAIDEVRSMFKQTESVIMATDNAIQDGVLPVANSATKATVSLTIDPRMLPQGVKPLSPAAQAIYDAAPVLGLSVPAPFSILMNSLLPFILLFLVISRPVARLRAYTRFCHTRVILKSIPQRVNDMVVSVYWPPDGVAFLILCPFILLKFTDGTDTSAVYDNSILL